MSAPDPLHAAAAGRRRVQPRRLAARARHWRCARSTDGAQRRHALRRRHRLSASCSSCPMRCGTCAIAAVRRRGSAGFAAQLARRAGAGACCIARRWPRPTTQLALARTDAPRRSTHWAWSTPRPTPTPRRPIAFAGRWRGSRAGHLATSTWPPRMVATGDLDGAEQHARDLPGAGPDPVAGAPHPGPAADGRARSTTTCRACSRCWPRAPADADAALYPATWRWPRNTRTWASIDRAFACLAAARRPAARGAPTASNATSALFEALMRAFPDTGARPRRRRSQRRRPIFVVGMPRSGTTLVERILTAHPPCYAAGELLNFGVVLKRLPAAARRCCWTPIRWPALARS